MWAGSLWLLLGEQAEGARAEAGPEALAVPQVAGAGAVGWEAGGGSDAARLSHTHRAGRDCPHSGCGAGGREA